MRRLAVVTVAAAIAVAGCGGGGNSSGVTPAAYVKARCLTLTAWKGAVQKAGTKIQAARPKTLFEGKHEYVAFVSELLSATRHAAAAMRAAGTPAVANGARIARALTSAFDGAAHDFQSLTARAAAIPTKGTSGYAKAVGALTTSVSRTLTKMGSISSGNSPTLQAAAKKSAACKSLVS
jgi:hypothetical protein